MTVRKVCCLLVAVVALPFVFQANTGCSFDPSGVCPDPCVQPPEGSGRNSYLCQCTCSAAMLHREFRVSFSEDDAEQRLSDNTVDLTSPDLDMSEVRVVGLRFRDVTIPQGAMIVNATVQFSSSATGTGPVAFGIRAQAADDAPAFSAVANDLGSRPVTMNFAGWSPPDWNADEQGSNQLTPNLQAVLKEVVDRPLWAPGNSLVLLVAPAIGAGVRHAESVDGRFALAPLLSVDYQEPAPAMVGPQDLPVCMTETLNPNLNGGLAPGDADLMADCTDRIQPTLIGLAEACGYPSNCTCTFQAGSQKFAAACDDPCDENPVDMDCADFDPVNGQVEATNAPGDAPVCLANSPLAYALFGRRTRCEVDPDMSTATVQVEDDAKHPSVSGILQFLGTPCPDGGCLVGLEYLLNIGSVTFGNFFGSETFEELAGLGKSTPGNEAALSMTGDGMFGQDAAEVSARGQRDSDQLALVTLNSDVVNVNVKFGSVMPTCALNGALLGSVDPELKRCEPHGPSANNVCTSDDECEDVEECSGEVCNCEQVSSAGLALALDLVGDIVNQPPTANAGEDQTLECTDVAGTPVTLDGTGSSDLDDNISLFSWRRGSRTGPEVGIDPVSHVLQPLGPESYVLRVIDAFAQSDEDTTMVDVTDTIPPELHCAVAKHVLEMLNHNLVNVGLTASALDQCEGTLPITVKVFGDENDEVNTGDGMFSPDAKNLAVGSLRLRAERRGNGNGRVYLVIVEASDSSGNRGFDCCTVIVPRSPRLQASLQSAEMQAVAAQNFCLANDGTAPAAYHVIGDGPIIGPKQ